MKNCVYGAQGFLICPSVNNVVSGEVIETFIGQPNTITPNKSLHFVVTDENYSGIWERCDNNCTKRACSGNNCTLQCNCTNCKGLRQQISTNVPVTLTDDAMKRTPLYYCGGQNIVRTPCKFASCSN